MSVSESENMKGEILTNYEEELVESGAEGGEQLPLFRYIPSRFSVFPSGHTADPEEDPVPDHDPSPWTAFEGSNIWPDF